MAVSGRRPGLISYEQVILFYTVAQEECREKLGAPCIVARGRIFIDIEVDRVLEVLKLRSVDNVNVILKMVTNFDFPSEREKCFEKLYKFAESPDWRKGMNVWKTVFDYKEDPIKEIRALQNDLAKPRPDLDLKNMKANSGIISNLPEDIIPKHLRTGDGSQHTEDTLIEKATETNKDQQQRTANGPKFRVSCNRTGSSHNFGSPEAARQFGAGVNEMFGWPVDLSKFDLEILLYIDTEFVYVGVCLTKEPLFKRNLSNFGPTNLRATTCYNMIRLAAPKLGDVVIDPMCGGATIPMEGSLTYPKAFHLGGDNFEQAVKRSRENVNNLLGKGKSMPVDVARWDVTQLPLRNNSADVIVSDLPFGKRLGSKVDNRVLYYRALLEMARVTKPETGRAVLLTQDRNSMIKNIKRVPTLWKSLTSRTVNIGGLTAVIFMLQRTALFPEGVNLEQIQKEEESS
ncbi:tRNA (guanine(6)-N2)-methyltransferase THUMP3-like isoform X3 [Macrobrachium rosenbergii]|uniref:tRNA (guanine(6)-N2)-methyltransferase THUMP3-like isoform X3 n=1 Tax=Macrobrachium rosenbergii TaxID=79674 RepID=UPI0034D439D7